MKILDEKFRRVKYIDMANCRVVLEDGEELPYDDVKEIIIVKRIVNPFSVFAVSFADMYVLPKEKKKQEEEMAPYEKR
ncbi:MAG: hypothetical protein ACTSXX_06060 [Candidatus Baldrarchaeia archaeon]